MNLRENHALIRRRFSVGYAMRTFRKVRKVQKYGFMLPVACHIHLWTNKIFSEAYDRFGGYYNASLVRTRHSPYLYTSLSGHENLIRLTGEY